MRTILYNTRNISTIEYDPTVPCLIDTVTDFLYSEEFRRYMDIGLELLIGKKTGAWTATKDPVFANHLYLLKQVFDTLQWFYPMMKLWVMIFLTKTLRSQPRVDWPLNISLTWNLLADGFDTRWRKANGLTTSAES